MFLKICNVGILYFFLGLAGSSSSFLDILFDNLQKNKAHKTVTAKKNLKLLFLKISKAIC